MRGNTAIERVLSSAILVKQLANRVQKSNTLSAPTVRRVNCLPPFDCFSHFGGMRVDKLDLSRQIVGISYIEKNQVVIAEIILDASCFWDNDRFAQRQIFKNSSGRIDFSKKIAVVWDDSQVTTVDDLDDLREAANAEVIDIPVQAALSGRFHHFIEKISSPATD